MPPPNLLTTTLILLLPTLTLTAGMYPTNSPVLSINAQTYGSLLSRSNHTSILEFYAPWCGHCQNLKPAYEKAASSLAGLATVAAIDCDDDANKPFCGSMGVRGFPTLKIIKPSRKPGGKGSAEDYNGERSTRGIVDAVKDKIPSYVSRVRDDGVDKFLGKEPGRAKALFFSEKGLVPAMVKAVAIDFLGEINFGFVRNADKKACERFGVKGFPSVILLPEGDADAEVVRFDGEVKRDRLVEFFSQVAPPHPGTLPVKGAKKAKGEDAKPKKEDKKKKDKPKAASETLEETSDPTESPDPKVAKDAPPPVQVPIHTPPSIARLDSAAALQKSCLHARANTCVLALLAAGDDDSEENGVLVKDLGVVLDHQNKRNTKVFPFYAVPASNPEGMVIAEKLGMEGGVAGVIAVNAKRGWWARGPSGTASIENWIEGIKLGDTKKETLPEGIVQEVVDEAVEEEKRESKSAEGEQTSTIVHEDL